MSVGVLAVLATLASPIVLVVAHILRDAQHNRQIQRSPRSVANIQRRVTHERAETEAANAPTEVLPVIQPTSTTEHTEVLPPVLPPRPRPYDGHIEVPPRPPTTPRPDPEVMARVLYGLRVLPTQPPRTPAPLRPSDGPDITQRLT